MTDPVDPKVEKTKVWLQTIVAGVEFSVKNQEDLENRSKGKTLIDSLDAEKASIRGELSKIEVKVGGGLLGGKSMKILDAGGDYRKEIDTYHHAGLLRDAMTPQQLKTVSVQMEKIMQVQAQLKKNPYYSAGEPNFTEIRIYDLEAMTDEERTLKINELAALEETRKAEEAKYARLKAECDRHMAEDLWEPMVREGIIPENFVPQDYSAVAKLFAGASAAYEERLQEYSASMSEDDLLHEKFKTGFKIGKGVLKLLTASTGLVGDVGDLAGDGSISEVTGEIADFLGYMETTLTITEGLTKAVLTDNDFTSVGAVLANTLGTVLASSGLDPLAANIISSVAANAVRAVSVAKKIKAGDLEGALTDLVAAVASELGRFDPDGKDGVMTLVGANLTKALAAKDIGKAIANSRSPQEMISAMMDAVDAIAGDALDGVGEDVMEKFNKAVGKDDEEKDEDEEDDEEDDGDEEDTSGSDWAEGEKARKGKFDMAALQKRREETDALAATKVALSMQEQMDAERAVFENHLRSGFPVPMDDQDEINISEMERLQSIEYIIAIQKKNEATFNMAKQIAEKGLALIAKIFPPAALAQSCMTLAFSIKDAIEKTQELIVWVENVEDATNAGSAQVDAMLNRRGLQGKQTMRANVQVAIEAARVVAAALALTPVAASAPVVKASADVAEAAIELADLIYTEVQLAKAWKIYVKARAVPQDRYLARKATRENPTLAKYAMAYGSLNGDPIAVEGMRRCGLDKQVLANPGTNVAKVVTYLECKYPEDPILLRAEPAPDKWYPGAIELTAGSFMNFYRMATTKASPLVDAAQDISGISAALGRLDEAEAAFQTALDAAAEAAKLMDADAAKLSPVELNAVARVTLTTTLIRTQDQLRKYKAMAPDKTPHPEMAKYIDAMSAKASLRLTAVAGVVEKRPWEALYRKKVA